MSRNLLFAAVGAAALAASSAPAAASTGDVKSIYALGRCIAGADRSAAGEMLRRLPLADTRVAVADSNLGRAGKCLKGGAPTVSSVQLRGAVAQALLLRDFPHFGVPPKISEGMFARFELPVDDATSTGVDAKTASLYRLADCVVRNQAIKTETLFRSGPGSALEERVIDNFAPTILACGADVRKLTVSRAHFRSLMAQAAYNVSVRYWTGKLWSAS